MKLVLDINDKSYQTILDFISLLPEHQCRVLADETEKLNSQKQPENKQNQPLHKQKLLSSGTTLLVALTIHNKEDLKDLQQHLKPRNKYLLGNEYYQSRLSVDTQFVEIQISEPTELQIRRKELTEGGLFLQFKGVEQSGILTSSIKLPLQVDGKNVADSLNHTFTLLSIEYEPWRKSHTGNIYDRILYQEKNKKWYPLDVLRSLVSIKQDEHELAFEARQKALVAITAK